MADDLLERIASGRTDLVFELLDLPDWRRKLATGGVATARWFVYYNDVTALKAILRAGGSLDVLDLDGELRAAAFFGHWKMCDFLLMQGASATTVDAETAETPLHLALCKADRPHYLHVIRLLLAHGADPNARTNPGMETGAFMRDARTRGETPLHRAAAYGDAAMIRCLVDHGADVQAKDANGDSPLTWASWHLRPGAILGLVTFGDHRISDRQIETLTSDHGCGWGNGMDWKLVGEYLPQSLPDD